MRRRAEEVDLTASRAVYLRNVEREFALPTRAYKMIAIPPDPFMAELHEHVLAVAIDPMLYNNRPYSIAVEAAAARTSRPRGDEKKRDADEPDWPRGLVIVVHLPPSIPGDIKAVRRITELVRAARGSRVMLITGPAVMGVTQRRVRQQDEAEWQGITFEFRLCSEFSIDITRSLDVPTYERMTPYEVAVECLRDDTGPRGWTYLPEDDKDIRKAGLIIGDVVRIKSKRGEVDQHGMVGSAEQGVPTPLAAIFEPVILAPPFAPLPSALPS